MHCVLVSLEYVKRYSLAAQILQYITYLGQISSTCNEIRDIFSRACDTHLNYSTHLHYGWTLFEESTGQSDVGLQVLDKLDRRMPGLYETQMHRINVHRRRKGDESKVDELFTQALEQYSSSKNDSSSQRSIYSAIASKYARFLHKSYHKESLALEVLRTAIKNDPQNIALYLHVIDILYQRHAIDVQEIVQVFDQAIANIVDGEEQYLMCTRKYEFLKVHIRVYLYQIINPSS